MILPAEGSRIYRYLLFIALFFFIVIGIKMTAYIVSLLIISTILTMLALPAMNLLMRKGLPDIVAVLVITICACAFILVLLVLMVFSFDVLIKDLPLYQSELNQRLSEILSLLNSHGIGTGSLSASFINLDAIIKVLLSSVTSIGDAMLYLFFIGVTTFFLLLEAPHLPGRIEKVLGKESEKLGQLFRMSRYMIGFVIVRTETNLVHGLVFGGVLSLMGVHAAMLWGIITFLLGYIPYIGLIIAAVPAIFFAWLQFGLWGAVAVIAVVCVLNIIVENPVFTYFASRKFEIPAFIVILSVIFWGWLLGLAGMIFAVPITLMVLIIIQCSDELRWVNMLLGVDRLFEEGTEKKGASDT
jgi:predicted PurR-regulated permease PerM